MEIETIYWLSETTAKKLADGWKYFSFAGGIILAIGAVIGFWANASKDEFAIRATDPERLDYWWHYQGASLVLEVKPRGGRWYPFVAVVPANERARLTNIVPGPSGRPPSAGITIGIQPVEEASNKYAGLEIQNAIDPQTSAYIYFSSPPSEIMLGQSDKKLAKIIPTPVDPKK